jgi:hypothetical protein
MDLYFDEYRNYESLANVSCVASYYVLGPRLPGSLLSAGPVTVFHGAILRQLAGRLENFKRLVENSKKLENFKE